MFKHASIVVLGVILLILICIAAAFAFFTWKSNNKYSSGNTVSTVLNTQNSDFAAGQQSFNQGNYSTAIQEYEAALPQAQDAEQRGVINFRIAYSSEQAGNFSTAISEYQQIYDDPANVQSIIRAYALQELGAMYYDNQYTSSANAIYTQTFKDPSLSNLVATSGIALTYRHLFEAAAAIYPLDYAEARIATWYSNDVAITLNGATTTTQGAADVAAVKNAVTLADQDMARTQNDEVNEMSLNGIVLELEGHALGQLANFGAADPQQVEQYFKRAVQTAAQGPTVEQGGAVQYIYALFLAEQYGNARASDITTLLAPFRSDNTQEIDPSIVAYFNSIENGISYSAQKKGAVLVANLDPNFKTYLISLGWHASDF